MIHLLQKFQFPSFLNILMGDKWLGFPVVEFSGGIETKGVAGGRREHKTFPGIVFFIQIKRYFFKYWRGKLVLIAARIH